MKKHLIITAISCLVVGALTGFVFAPFNNVQDLNNQAQKYFYALGYMLQHSVSTPDAEKVTENAIRAALETLNDPYSEYLPRKQKENFEEEFRGNFQGIGIRFGIINDSITVTTPLIDGPSDKAGLEFNDKIVKINGVNAVGMKNDSVPTKLKGPAGTQVTVTIKRQGRPDLFDVKITRGVVPTTSVEAAYMLDNTDVGYVYASKFSATITKDIVEAVKRLKKEGMKKLILDLRNNRGGYMNEAQALSDEFVKGGHKVVFTKDRTGAIRDSYSSRDGGSLEDVPVIVMINRGSASASEIVAGALQDLDRGLVVGETSFGKGLVQNIFALQDGSGVKFTTARYYTPSGRLIQRPYKDKRDIIAFDNQPDNREGSNSDHKNEADTSRPTFKTLRGRTVLGGGGIVPDYVIKSDTSRTKFFDTLASKGLFWEAAQRFALQKGQQVRTQVNKDLKTYLTKYKIGEDYIATLRALCTERKVTWNEQDFKEDDRLMKTMMQGALAFYLWGWGDTSVVGAMLQYQQLEKAVKLFPEAIKFAHAK